MKKSKYIKIKIGGKSSKWDTNKNVFTKGESNIKINKSEKHGVFSTMILHLSPSNMSGFDVCSKSSVGCENACLNKSGHGGMFQEGKIQDSKIHIARIGRTTLLMTNKKLFFSKAKKEINRFLKRCENKNTKPAVRMNGTSDLPWENMKDPETQKTLIELYPQVQFYDYTKIFSRLKKSELPENYNLTFSRSESNEAETIESLVKGFNVAVVFKGKELPELYSGFKVINGDQTDLRFLDNKIFKNNSDNGVVVGLTTKGWRARKDNSGFAVDLELLVQGE